jgi:hypothetical protein
MAIFRCVGYFYFNIPEGNVQSVTTCKKRQKTSEADSFRNMKVEISNMLEDGHRPKHVV